MEIYMKIGNLETGILALGPMAGVTDFPFRLLCKEQGADIVYTEMVSAKGILYRNKNTAALLKTGKEEMPVGLQLFGEDPEIMADMAARVEELNFDFFDVNMGCPVPKVVGNGEGSALMKNPKRAGEIVSTMVKSVRKPVTVKFRKGFEADDNSAAEFAKVLEAAGASALAVHGRTREQYYSGKADWSVIADVKKAVGIPVIGNGDIFSPVDAKRMLDETGCDAIMLARGVRGNPWLFSRVKSFLENGTDPGRPAVSEVMEMIRRHAAMMIEFKGEYTAIREMRKHVSWYTAGYPGSSMLRQKVNEVTDFTKLDSLLREYERWHETCVTGVRSEA